ncbi:unnamed protein product [Fasciola hepatica]|uniref:Uncharacterized protein n=1 Tax=Fasciola hepatica TaxID=6192 RepID=A0ABC9HIP2_FASHE|nr:unnamed protein product [Fasciola hepatica]
MIFGNQPFDGTQATTAPGTTATASGHQRRVRTGVSRSHSQGTADILNPRTMGSVTVPEAQGFPFPPSFYQGSISHTVPLEEMGPGIAWPPFPAQRHYRRPLAGDPAVFASYQVESRVARKECSLLAGCSSNDLIHLNLVRQGETSKPEYSLSVRLKCDLLHMKFSVDPNSNQYMSGEYSQPYPTVSAVICRYMQILLPVRGTTPVLLLFSVCPSSSDESHHVLC